MECTELAGNLADFLDGALPPEAEAAALEHLATCPSCELVLAQTKSVLSLAGKEGRAELTPGERDELLRRIVAADPETA